MHHQPEQEIKLRNYEALNRTVKKGSILFTGSSLMEQFPIVELFQSHNCSGIVYNRGIGGFTTEDFLGEINTMLFDLAPAKVFINIGTNDIAERQDGKDWKEALLSNYRQILCLCKEKIPSAQVNLLAYYPSNLKVADGASWCSLRTLDNLNEINHKVQQLAQDFDYTFINANEGLHDALGNLKEEYTIDGVHLYAGAYMQVFKNLLPYL